MKEVTVFAPATVANVSCGFDVLGFCLDHVGDEITVRKSETQEFALHALKAKIYPKQRKNVAGVAVEALLEHVETSFGFEIEIKKGIKAGSGIGSSAASSAGAVYGVNALLGNPFTKNELIPFAMRGEELASGAAHADNVSPALLGVYLSAMWKNQMLFLFQLQKNYLQQSYTQKLNCVQQTHGSVLKKSIPWTKPFSNGEIWQL